MIGAQVEDAGRRTRRFPRTLSYDGTQGCVPLSCGDEVSGRETRTITSCLLDIYPQSMLHLRWHFTCVCIRPETLFCNVQSRRKTGPLLPSEPARWNLVSVRRDVMHRKQWFLISALCLYFSSAAQAQTVLSAARRIDWSQAGVVGSIPSRSTVCATLSPGATAAQIN